MQQVQTQTICHGLQVINNLKSLTIRHKDYSVELNEPPNCKNAKEHFPNLKKFSDFLKTLPAKKVIILHQYLCIEIKGQLIVIKLRASNNAAEVKNEIKVIDCSREKVAPNPQKIKGLFNDTGFLNKKISKRGNCMGMAVFIYQKSGKYFASFSTCYFIAFNTAIFRDEALRNDLTLQYSCVLVSTFQDEVQRNMCPMVEYGKIKCIIRSNNQSGLNICEITSPKDIFEEVGYMSLKFLAQSTLKYTSYEYQKISNQKQYGLAFWRYDLYKREVTSPNNQNRMNVIHINDGKLAIDRKNNIFIEEAISQMPQLQQKNEFYLCAMMQKYYDQVHEVNYKLIHLQFKENKDNNDWQQSIQKLLKQREEIYYKFAKYQQNFFSFLSEEAIQHYRQIKEQQLIQYSARKANVYGVKLDYEVGTKLKINSFLVYRSDIQPRNRNERQRNLSASKLNSKSIQKGKVVNLEKILASPPQKSETKQFTDRKKHLIAILEKLKQKELLAQYYLLNNFYRQHHKALIDLNLTQLLRLDDLVNSKNSEHIHDPKCLILEQEGQKLAFKSLKNKHFHLREQMEYAFSYNDEYYCYHFDLSFQKDLNKGKILQIFKAGSMFQLYRKFQEDAGKYRVFLSSGYAIINTDLLIKLNRYKKPIYSSNKPKEYPINAYYDDNVINKDIKENLKNNWKSKPNKKSGLENNGEHISCPIISSMVTVTCFWENMDTKQVILRTHPAYLIGINGLICTQIVQPKCRLLDSWAYFCNAKKYERISQWANQSSCALSVGMFQNLESISQIMEGYLGLQFHVQRNAIKPLQSKDAKNFNVTFKNFLKIVRDQQNSSPFIEVENSQTNELIRKLLSQLSNFQILCEEIVLSLVNNLSVQMCESYQVRKTFQSQYENEVEFKKAIEGNRSFFNERNKAIAQYHKIIDYHQQLKNLIDDYKDYSNVDLNATIKQRLILKYQNKFDLKPLTLQQSTVNQKLNEKSYDQKEDISFCIAKIFQEKNRLEQEKCYLQAHLLVRFIEEEMLLKTGQSIKKMYLVQDKQESKHQTSNNLPFYTTYTKFQLPKIAFHNVLPESERSIAKLSPEVRYQSQLEKAMAELFTFDELQYEKLVNQILNEPLSENEKLNSLNLLFGLHHCIKTEKEGKILKGKDHYMKYLFYMYSSLSKQYSDRSFYLLKNRVRPAGSPLDDNEIKSKLSMMDISLGFPVKHINSFLIELDMPSEIKLELIDLRNKVQKIIFDQQNEFARIEKIQYIKNKIKQKETNKISIFVKSIAKIYVTDPGTNKKKIVATKKEFLALEDFDYDFNIFYPKFTKTTKKKRVDTRGGFPFYSPSNCTKLALKVEHKFENNLWLGMDYLPGEWAIAYHGLTNPLTKLNPSMKDEHTTQEEMDSSNSVQNIIRHELKPGRNQDYKNHQCVIAGCRSKINQGIYFSPSFQIVASQYASGAQSPIPMNRLREEDSLINNSPFSKQTKKHLNDSLAETRNQEKQQNYSIIFMNRLRPNKIHIPNRTQVPQSDKNLYWVVNEPVDCRTYAVLLINSNQIKDFPKMDEQFGQFFYYETYKDDIDGWRKNQTLTPISRKAQRPSQPSQPVKKGVKNKDCQIY